jgi:hypothetical protein
VNPLIYPFTDPSQIKTFYGQQAKAIFTSRGLAEKELEMS